MLGLGSSSQFGIGIAIQLQDQFSGTADKIEKRLKQLKKESYSNVTSAMREYRNNAAGIAAGASAVTFGFYSMAKSASEFGHKINQIDILGEGKLGKTKKQLGDFALGLSRDFATMPNDVANAMLENTRAGVTSGMDVVTKYQLAVSKATGENVSSVSENLLGITNSYNMSMSQFGDVANAVTAAANQSMASVSSIGESMEYAAFTASKFNIKYTETLALVAKLSQSNIKGSAAGTAINNMIQYLGTSVSDLASKKQKEMWEKLGLDRKEMKGMMDSGNVFGVIDAMDKAMAGISPSEKSTILRNITNMRGSRAMMGAWGSADPSKSLMGLLSGIEGGVKNDIAMGQSKAMMDDPYSQFLRVQVAWEQFKIKFIASSAPVIMKVLAGAEKFLGFATRIADTPVGTILGGVIAVGAPLIGILFGFRAALLTATIALRGFSAGGGVGFGNLMRAGIDINSKGYGAARGITAGMQNIGKNAAGFPMVKAGGTVTYMGKVYKGGQMLPRSILMGNIAGNAASLAGAGGMLGGLGGRVAKGAGGLLGKAGMGGLVNTVGKAVPILTKIAGFGARFLPIVGWGLTLWSIYDVIKGMRQDKKAEEKEPADPFFLAYKKELDNSIFSSTRPEQAGLFNSQAFVDALNKQKEATKLQQQIILNVDGTNIFNKQMEQSMDDSMNQQLPFNIGG